MEQSNAEAASAKMKAAMGIEDTQPEASETPKEPEKEPEEKSKPEKKSETKEEPEEEKSEEKEDKSDKDKDEKEQKSRSERPVREDKAERAAFTQIKELRQAVDKILERLDKPADKKEATQADEDLQALAQELGEGADPEKIGKLASTIESRLLKKLESEGKLSKTSELSEEDREALKEIKEERQQRQWDAHFNQEWTEVLPELKKQYPNATDSMLQDARKELDSLAHTKEFHTYKLDYVVFRNKSMLDTLLKVAKGNRSGEREGKDLSTDEPDEQDPSKSLDLDPEFMSPDKYKNYIKRNMKQGK